MEICIKVRKIIKCVAISFLLFLIFIPLGDRLTMFYFSNTRFESLDKFEIEKDLCLWLPVSCKKNGSNFICSDGDVTASILKKNTIEKTFSLLKYKIANKTSYVKGHQELAFKSGSTYNVVKLHQSDSFELIDLINDCGLMPVVLKKK